MALRVAGDADLGEPPPQLVHRGEQTGRAGELARRLTRVPCDHEDLAHVRRLQPLDHLLEMLAIADEPGRQVRDHVVAAPPQPLGELQRRLHSLARRGRDRELDLGRNVPGDLVLDPVQGKDLVAGSLQGGDQGRVDGRGALRRSHLGHGHRAAAGAMSRRLAGPSGSAA